MIKLREDLGSNQKIQMQVRFNEAHRGFIEILIPLCRKILIAISVHRTVMFTGSVLKGVLAKRIVRLKLSKQTQPSWHRVMQRIVTLKSRISDVEKGAFTVTKENIL